MARVGVGLGLGMGEDVRDEVSRGRCPGAWRQMSEHGRQQVVSATCDGRGGGVRQCFSGWQTDTPARASGDDAGWCRDPAADDGTVLRAAGPGLPLPASGS